MSGCQGVTPTVYGEVQLERSRVVFNELRLAATPPMAAIASAVFSAIRAAVDVRLRKTRGLIRLKGRSLSPVAKLFLQAAQSRAAAARK